MNDKVSGKNDLDGFKKAFKKADGTEYTDDEAWDARENLVGFFALLLKVDRRLKKQKDNGDGETTI